MRSEIDNNILLDLAKKGILSSILDSSNDGFSYTDNSGHIVYFNSQYISLTGIDVDSILDKSIYSLSAHGYPVSKMMIQVFETKMPTSQLIKYQVDSEKQIMVTVSPVYNNHGEFAGCVAVFRDLTELLHLKREMDVYYLHAERELAKKEAEKHALHSQIDAFLNLNHEYNLVGSSQHMQSLTELAYRISHVNSTVLITGESGVGKDVFCKMVSQFSGSGTYTKISCGAIPESLLESELFGYEAGAFTGAKKEGKAGLFELAGEGIIFLDEIGEMPMNMQVKLLTVLQDRKFYRIGGVQEIPMKARIIAATNRVLKEEVKEGRFREDLYYRINVIPITIAPLRERKEDILPLAEHILNDLNRKNKTIKILSNEICSLMIRYDWPGNIRELHNLVERMYVLSSNDVISTDVLPEEIATVLGIKDTKIFSNAEKLTLKQAIEQFEAHYLMQHLKDDLTLEQISNNMDVNLSTLVRKINKYNLPKRYKKINSQI